MSNKNIKLGVTTGVMVLTVMMTSIAASSSNVIQRILNKESSFTTVEAASVDEGALEARAYEDEILGDAELYGTMKYYVTSTDGVNVRQYRSADLDTNKIIGELKYSEEVEVIKELGYDTEEWVKIKYKDGIAYVCAEYLSVEKPKYEAYMGQFKLTAYEYTGNPCYNENWPTVGYTVATNAADFPIGTKLYIEGMGEYVVEDRGVPSGTIDIYMEDVSTCYEFGVHYADVYVISW